jgi:excisionase family DNA binding protein
MVLTVKEVAERLKVHPNYVYGLIERREIEVLELGKRAYRITEEAFDRFRNAKTVRVK